MLALGLACGAGTASDGAFFWRVDRSAVQWGPDCSDDPQLRASVRPFTSNQFFAYQVAPDGRTAVDLECTTNRLSACQRANDSVYSVGGSELSRTSQLQRVYAGTSCMEQSTLTVTFDSTDGGQLRGDVAVTIALLPAPDGGQRLPDGGGLGFDGGLASCRDIDEVFRLFSQNDAGLQGCVYMVTVEATRIPHL